jgi:hypothetical protein
MRDFDDWTSGPRHYAPPEAEAAERKRETRHKRLGRLIMGLALSAVAYWIWWTWFGK